MSAPERLVEIAGKLEIAHVRRHIFLCADQTTTKCSTREDSLTSWEYLKKRLAELGLNQGENCVYRTKANCLRLSVSGPVAVLYPDGKKYTSAIRWHERLQIEHIL